MRHQSPASSTTNYQSGQILLLSLLVLVVVLVVGLSLAARTVSTLRTTTVQNNSIRAFSAAEAGMEQALTTTSKTTITGSLSGSDKYEAQISKLSGDELSVSNGDFISEDTPADIWLGSYPDFKASWSGQLKIFWGAATDSCIDKPETNNTMAAVELVLIHGSKSSPRIDHFAYDPCAVRRNSHNHFSATQAGGSAAGSNFAYSVTLPVVNGILLRVIPLYAGTHLAIKGPSLPAQGTIITSVGTSGDTKRKIITYRGFPAAPMELFPFLIFSPK